MEVRPYSAVFIGTVCLDTYHVAFFVVAALYICCLGCVKIFDDGYLGFRLAVMRLLAFLLLHP